MKAARRNITAAAIFPCMLAALASTLCTAARGALAFADTLPVRAASGNTFIKLAWDPPEGREVRAYRIYRPGGEQAFIEVNRPEAEDLGLTNGTSYTYRVVAVLPDGREWKGYELVTVAPRGRNHIAFVVEMLESVHPTAFYVVEAGSGRGKFAVVTHGFHVQSANGFGKVVTVPAGKAYDILMDMGGDLPLLPVAENVTSEAGQLKSISIEASIGFAVIEPPTKQGFPQLQEVTLIEQRSGFQLRATHFGQRMVVPVGRYHLNYKTKTGRKTKSTWPQEMFEVKSKQAVVIETDQIISGFIVEEMEGITPEAFYVVEAGSGRDKFAVVTHGFHVQAADGFEKAMTVPANQSYDILMDLGSGKPLVSVAENGTAERGRLVRISIQDAIWSTTTELELAPMSKPSLEIGYKWVGLKDGKSYWRTLVSENAEIQTWKTSEGCSFTSKTDLIGSPWLEWSNCSPYADGTQTFSFEGEIWPLDVGKKWRYTITGSNVRGDRWSRGRTCEVLGTAQISTGMGLHDTYKTVCKDSPTGSYYAYYMSPELRTFAYFEGNGEVIGKFEYVFTGR